jgi:hypothetical protein
MSKVFSVMSNVDEYKKLPQKILPSLPEFTPGRIQGEELGKLFGTLSPMSVQSEEDGYSACGKTTEKSPEAPSSPVIRQLLDEPHTVANIHAPNRELYHVACLSDEEIWTSGRQHAINLFNINQESLIKSIGISHIAHDIAVTNNGDLVYSDFHGRTVNILMNEKQTTIQLYIHNWKPQSICCTSSDDLLVTMDCDDGKQSKVVRYTGSTEKQTIQFDDQGDPLYFQGYSKFMKENGNLDICVGDYAAKRVVVVNQAGKLRFMYTGLTSAQKKKPFIPRGITTDSWNYILTVDVNNDCIHIIDQDGKFLRYLDCELSEPCGMCIDTNNNLLVAQRSINKVKKIKYQQ